MPFLGAHLSIVGGLPRAVERARATGCEALQIFTKSTGQWRARPIGDAEAEAFRAAVALSGLHAVTAHASYLINVASVDPALRARSMAGLEEELDRAARLGLDALVLHPGSAADDGGLVRVADAVGELLARRGSAAPMLLLEHTAGQGSNLGHRFEHLATVLALLDWTPHVGICLDTCHLVAAGYDLASASGYAETFREFERVVGLDRVKLFHLNDSKAPLASRVDRHTHVGEGHVGTHGFARLVNDSRFAQLPMLLETPKSCGRARTPPDRDPLDVRNLKRLRRLMTAGALRTPPLRSAGSARRVATRRRRARP
jgi:deoxyribonuclease IV